MSATGVTLVATPVFVAITAREFLLLALVVGGGLLVTWLVLRLVLRETVRASGRVLPRRDTSSVDSTSATDIATHAALFAADGDAHGHRRHHAHAGDADSVHRHSGHAHSTGSQPDSDGGHHHGTGHTDSHDWGGGDSSGDGGSSSD